MDCIAELVLSYADEELGRRLSSKAHLCDHKILRYRDDYRIFVNSESHGSEILKLLTETLRALGMKLNAGKTSTSSEVIRTSIKEEKLAWIRRAKEGNLQKRLLTIHDHGKTFPEAGSLMKALTSYYRILPERKVNDPLPLIAIAVDIAYCNPRTYPISAAIISKLLASVEKDVRQGIVENIVRRFEYIPNTGYMQIWLQRITRPVGIISKYTESICRVVDGENVEIWDNSWLRSSALRNLVDVQKIIHKERLETLPTVVSLKEVELFMSSPYS